MNEDNAKQDKESKIKKVNGALQKKKQLLYIWIVLVVLIIALVGLATWFYKNIQRSEALKQKQLSSIQIQLENLSDELKQAQQKNLAIQTQLEDTNQQQQLLKNKLKALQAQSQMSGLEIRKQWALSEVKYLLDVANQRAVLRHDVKGAIAALTMADDALKQLNDYQLHELRAKIAEEKQALTAVAANDIEGMALTLLAAEKRVNTLTVKAAQPIDDQGDEPATESANSDAGWHKAANDIWQKIRSLVVIRYDDNGKAPTLKPKERYFLYQNLNLQLEAAHLALLKSDDTGFKQSLQTSIDWLNTYFIGAEKEGMIKSLQPLLQSTAKVNIPDISGSLSWLKEYQQ